MAKMRYLRHIIDGYIYEWNPILAANDLCREVTEEEAYPERFIPEAQKGRKPKVDLTTEDVPEAPVQGVAPEIAAEASMGLGLNKVAGLK